MVSFPEVHSLNYHQVVGYLEDIVKYKFLLYMKKQLDKYLPSIPNQQCTAKF